MILHIDPDGAARHSFPNELSVLDLKNESGASTAWLVTQLDLRLHAILSLASTNVIRFQWVLSFKQRMQSTYTANVSINQSPISCYTRSVLPSEIPEKNNAENYRSLNINQIPSMCSDLGWKHRTCRLQHPGAKQSSTLTSLKKNMRIRWTALY